MNFESTISIRWADLDPNFHVRHSAYYDWGAQQRFDVLTELGMTMQVMKQFHLGPVLFREECVFRKEIRMGDVITIKLYRTKVSEDGSRWSLRHVLTNQRGELCATINVDGAWIDTQKRKLAAELPLEARGAIDKMPMIVE